MDALVPDVWLLAEGLGRVLAALASITVGACGGGLLLAVGLGGLPRPIPRAPGRLSQPPGRPVG